MEQSNVLSPARVSFNQWLSLHKGENDPFAPLARQWVSKRGRLSAQSVGARAVLLGLSSDIGEKAYAAYLAAIS